MARSRIVVFTPCQTRDNYYFAENYYKMINTDYNQEDHIVYLRREGEIKIQDLMSVTKSVSHSFQNLQSLHIIDDVRNSISNFNSNYYPILIKEIGKVAKSFSEVRHAIIVDTPSDTVLSIMFEEISRNLDNYSYKTFSTEEGAKGWIATGLY